LFLVDVLLHHGTPFIAPEKLQQMRHEVPISLGFEFQFLAFIDIFKELILKFFKHFILHLQETWGNRPTPSLFTQCCFRIINLVEIINGVALRELDQNFQQSNGIHPHIEVNIALLR
jgi:hypothetical protein